MAKFHLSTLPSGAFRTGACIGLVAAVLLALAMAWLGQPPAPNNSNLMRYMVAVATAGLVLLVIGYPLFASPWLTGIGATCLTFAVTLAAMAVILASRLPGG